MITMTSVEFYELCMTSSDSDVYKFIEQHHKECSNWDLGLTGACKSGNKDVQQMMIIFGANYCGNCGKKATEHKLL